jgi:hypothetical protein
MSGKAKINTMVCIAANAVKLIEKGNSLTLLIGDKIISHPA